MAENRKVIVCSVIVCWALMTSAGGTSHLPKESGADIPESRHFLSDLIRTLTKAHWSLTSLLRLIDDTLTTTTTTTKRTTAFASSAPLLVTADELETPTKGEEEIVKDYLEIKDPSSLKIEGNEKGNVDEDDQFKESVEEEEIGKGRLKRRKKEEMILGEWEVNEDRSRVYEENREDDKNPRTKDPIREEQLKHDRSLYFNWEVEMKGRVSSLKTPEASNEDHIKILGTPLPVDAYCSRRFEEVPTLLRSEKSVPLLNTQEEGRWWMEVLSTEATMHRYSEYVIEGFISPMTNSCIYRARVRLNHLTYLGQIDSSLLFETPKEHMNHIIELAKSTKTVIREAEDCVQGAIDALDDGKDALLNAMEIFKMIILILVILMAVILVGCAVAVAVGICLKKRKRTSVLQRQVSSFISDNDDVTLRPLPRSLPGASGGAVSVASCSNSTAVQELGSKSETDSETEAQTQEQKCTLYPKVEGRIEDKTGF